MVLAPRRDGDARGRSRPSRPAAPRAAGSPPRATRRPPSRNARVPCVGRCQGMATRRQPSGTGFALRDPLPWRELAGIVRELEPAGYAAVFLPRDHGARRARHARDVRRRDAPPAPGHGRAPDALPDPAAHRDGCGHGARALGGPADPRSRNGRCRTRCARRAPGDGATGPGPAPGRGARGGRRLGDPLASSGA